MAASFSTNASIAADVQLLRLLAHAADDAAQLRVEVVAVDATRGLADVAQQIGAALDLGDHLQQRDHLAQLAGHRRLEREDPDALLLEVDAALVDLLVAADEVLGAFQVAVEQHRGGARDQLDDQCSQPRQLVAGRLELVVVGLAQLVHQPNLPVT